MPSLTATFCIMLFLLQILYVSDDDSALKKSGETEINNRKNPCKNIAFLRSTVHGKND